MSETLTLSAELRERAGKGASRVLRREGRTPAVIYGGNQEPVAIHLEEKALAKALGTGHFFNSIIELTVGGQTVRTLAKDVAFHAVTDRPQHADFLRVTARAEVHVNVPVVFENEAKAPGIKAGGVLNIVRHELELVCEADKIPENIVVDLAGLEVGDSVHISAVNLPKGTASAITDRDFTIATIATPTVLTEEEAGEATTEG
jgi:large subunit ribosomal protein L25